MPTATVTSTTTSAAATLRTLYNRAARAFLLRDIHQTHSLLSDAFSLIHPPSDCASDPLAAHRRKWDILRITLETTTYSSPPANNNPPIPHSLQVLLSLPSHSLLNTLHQRSLSLFTPTPHPHPTKPSSAYLPSQVLITLVLSSIKLDCPAVGRAMIEDWLGKRAGDGGEEYEKVLDMYCLHVLPRLEEWDYANEFLQYENELPPQQRQRLISSFQTLYTSAHTHTSPSPSRTPTPTPQNPSPRCVSPASSTSSVSTTSTHTAVPRTPRPNARSKYALAGLTPSSSSSSVASELTATPIVPNGNNSSSQRHTSPHPRTTTTKTPSIPHANGSALPPPPTTHLSPSPSIIPLTRTTTTSTSSTTRHPSSTLSLLRTTLSPYLTSLSSSRLTRITTFLILFVLLPLVSLLLRIRRRRRRLLGAGGGTGVEVVRRRLGLGRGEGGVIGRAWGELVRAVGDTVRMGGGGLV